MANRKVTPGSLTNAYIKREGDFAPDLVGFQLTKGTPLFTLGNFSVTTNYDAKENTYFNTGEFAGPYTLNNLGISEQYSEFLVSNNIYTTLNLDPTDLSKFVYFGSMVEFLRVNVEGIITKWKGSLYITEDEGGFSRAPKYTVLNYSYDSLTDISTVKIPTLFVENNFDLITNDLGGVILDENDISNIKLSFNNYILSNEYGDFQLLSYVGDSQTNPYIDITVQGEAFPTLTGASFGTFDYHVKPKYNILDRLFFDKLSDFENILMNRLTSPQYTSTYESPMETESGTLLSTRKSFTWPTTDGYNIDVNTVEYGQFLEGLLKMAEDFDRFRYNLMTRRFIANSIHEFDTDDDGTGNDSQSRKVNKLLKIYGREFDEVKKYVDSIQDAHVVTYNKKNNIPDELIKDMAKTLGFDAIKSVSDNKLLTYIAKSNEIIFEGQSRSMSTKEIDVELWRRLVINAWWLFKSKGHRKVIEFLVKLFGLNECLVNIDECIYVVKDKLDVEETFSKIVSNLYGEDVTEEDLGDEFRREAFPIDEQGFPRTLPNTPDYYFQMHGFWYNNGTLNPIGNNPHLGPYDYGNAYFDAFRCFIDEPESGRTKTIRTDFIENINLFSDYNTGDLEITFEDGKPLDDYGTPYAQIMEDAHRVSPMTNMLQAGFSTEKSRTGRGSLKLTFTCGDEDSCEVLCPLFDLDQTGVVVVSPIQNPVTPMDKECCEFHGFEYAPSQFEEEYTSQLTGQALEMYNQYLSILYRRYGQDYFDNGDGNFLCYWCKPVLPICEYDVYINTVIQESGTDGLIEVLINEGIMDETQTQQFLEWWSNPERQKEMLNYISNYFNTTYEGYCLLVHEGFETVSKECCEVRNGEWVDVLNDLPNKKSEADSSDSNVRNQPSGPTTLKRCIIRKPPPPPPDPCDECKDVEYCPNKELESQMWYGFNLLDEGVRPTNEELEVRHDSAYLFRADRDAYMKAQNQGFPDGVIQPPTYDPNLYGDMIGGETVYGSGSWQTINYLSCCDLETYYGYHEQGGFGEDGSVGPAYLAPCGFCDGGYGCCDDEIADGTVLIFNPDLEDVFGDCRQKRDAALKAKNELSLSIMPFLMANDYVPYYQIWKCKSLCGLPCTSESQRGCPLTNFRVVERGCSWAANSKIQLGTTPLSQCLNVWELTDEFGGSITSNECCIAASQFVINDAATAKQWEGEIPQSVSKSLSEAELIQAGDGRVHCLAFTNDLSSGPGSGEPPSGTGGFVSFY